MCSSRPFFVTAPTSLNGGQPHFARCLAVSWAGTLYTFLGALASQRNSVRCKIHFASRPCLLLYWQRYCTAFEQWSSAKLCDVVSSRDRAAIPFDIGRSNCLVVIVLLLAISHPAEWCYWYMYSWTVVQIHHVRVYCCVLLCNRMLTNVPLFLSSWWRSVVSTDYYGNFFHKPFCQICIVGYR